MGFLSLILWNHKLSKSFQFTASSTTFYVYIHTDLNTLDWGRNNLVAIGLGPDVFLWNAGDGSVRKLLELNRETRSVLYHGLVVHSKTSGSCYTLT